MTRRSYIFFMLWLPMVLVALDWGSHLMDSWFHNFATHLMLDIVIVLWLPRVALDMVMLGIGPVYPIIAIALTLWLWRKNSQYVGRAIVIAPAVLILACVPFTPYRHHLLRIFEAVYLYECIGYVLYIVLKHFRLVRN